MSIMSTTLNHKTSHYLLSWYKLYDGDYEFNSEDEFSYIELLEEYPDIAAQVGYYYDCIPFTIDYGHRKIVVDFAF